eukprot:Gregarina_sp_Pseudo_9__3743@NODE_388_length_2959_cov_23_497260_g366_i0_p3_GENE_NODE_388_length_2959_cov_23_497260_g366_i0NODE_388_length_2959_cov_23_497260_g366_i0_p3_ORF_typecomplete_len134_score13_87Use1/PF09753_9/0_00027Sec20/PF03908_13/0_00084Vip3A_N/PF12495_8/0_046Orf78/PF06024_12/0_22PRT_C/PF08372_10/4_2_NODE_388_length_2959_cov_23_497260_g366_i023672768
MATWRGPPMSEEYDQRNALFGNRNNRQTPNWEQRQRDAAVVEVLESINDNKIHDLEARVGELKDVSLRLRDEVQESNTLLGGMTNQFDRVGGMVKMSLRRLNLLSSFKTSKHLWLLAIFIACVLAVLYVISFF